MIHKTENNFRLYHKYYLYAHIKLTYRKCLRHVHAPCIVQDMMDGWKIHIIIG